MPFSISSVKTAIKAPLLSYNFIVEGIPNVPALNIRSAQVPSKSVEDIKIRVRGRDVHFAGNIGRFEPWPVRIFEDISYTARTMLELWSQVIADNSTGFGFATPVITKNIDLFLLAPGTEHIVAIYRLYNCFPQMLGSVELDYDQVDTPVTYTVNFAYDFWVRQDVAEFGSLDSLLTSVL